MKHWLMTGVLMAGASFATGASAQANGNDPANPLITDKWNFRPLIVVTPDAGQPAYRHLRQQLDRTQAQFDDRDMLLYTIEGESGTRHGRPMTAYETKALLDAVDVSPEQGVTTILIGKDGGKKVQLQGEVDLQEIYATIDRMPMRQAGDD
ncbi:DUF4174 domain-containing protein [Salinicola corii]|uniref:DUF4174 domain-containing protein n=1 Tax=Salinicola corii TaxID=2606937 RepID=A0A640WD65_9GAMM|nr:MULTISPECIES: DUF4174 domain-containing protein [Salinicola]KAA0017460.1 DUF4174 domain-containing protein [Salinicola corii]MAM58686.1 hypothetical protein [Salinicola sp.]NRB57606.1 DUF4174 domain-containing protein [Salinicola sp.]